VASMRRMLRGAMIAAAIGALLVGTWKPICRWRSTSNYRRRRGARAITGASGAAADSIRTATGPGYEALCSGVKRDKRVASAVPEHAPSVTRIGGWGVWLPSKPTFTITRYTTPHGGPDEASPSRSICGCRCHNRKGVEDCLNQPEGYAHQFSIAGQDLEPPST
jgi:hypothetical protein